VRDKPRVILLRVGSAN